jgi:hypothetical protein
MCSTILTFQPGLHLSAKVRTVPHSTDLNLQLWQTLPTAENPRSQCLLNVCLPREDLARFGRVLVAESYVTT